MSNRIYLSPPHLTGKEIKYVKQVFDSNWVAPIGPDLDLFEKEISDKVNQSYCICLTTGTSSIHMALILLGVKEGDEVLCQSLTFIGSVNPVLYQKAIPIFIDSEPETWNICPDSLEEAIKDRIQKTGKKPKAIIPVHLYGMPAKMKEIQTIASNYEIPIIEDAAEALGSSIDEKKCGSFGDLSIFSFNGNKIITTSGGGALLSNKKEFIDRAKFLSTQARDPAAHYEHSQLGYNYRMSNVLAGIGRGQMQVLEERIRARRENNTWYRGLFNKEVQFQNEPKGYFSNYWLTSVLFKNAENISQLSEIFHKENIESRPLWKPMHLQPLLQHYPYYGENRVAESLFAQGVCLPSGSNLDENQKERIQNCIFSLSR